MVGNSALRIGAIGWEDEPADDRGLANMRAMLREAHGGGRVRHLSGLDYPPGSYASTDELAALPPRPRGHGGFYHTHVRYPLGDRFLDPFREAIEIGRRGEGPVHITHFYHRQTFPGRRTRCWPWSTTRGPPGMDVTFDAYPYEWASTRLLIQLPQWVQAGGPMRSRSAWPTRAVRDRIRTEMAARGAAYAVPPAGPTCGSAPSAGPTTCAGSRAPWRTSWTRPAGTRWMRSASCCCPRTCGWRRSRPAHGPRPPPLPAAPVGDGRHRLDLPRREAVAAHLRQLPADPGPVRA